jgi:hypothetical protein
MPNLVGIGLSQVPTNSMLGGLAYQSPDHASIKDLDLKNLSQINSEIADTAVDIFVYDTSKDSDGGAWRKRTQHTSWYNETLNTATRGSRREFPAVAVIVAETSRVVIYDGDDPDLPMWMVFDALGNASGTPSVIGWFTSGSVTMSSISAKNGIIVFGSDGGTVEAFLIKDDFRICYGSTGHEINGNWIISKRNIKPTSISSGTSFNLRDRIVNDVAMTVLPNAPIDIATGLPVPTIAVATNTGVSVIKDDGTVVDIYRTSDDNVYYVSLDGDRVIMYMALGAIYVATIPSADQSGNPNAAWSVYGSFSNNTSGVNYPAIQAYGSGVDLVSMKDHTFATAGWNSGSDQYKGLSILSENVNSSGNGMVAWAHADFNTGWMHENIKGAFLSDTTVESLTANTNLASNFVQTGTNRLTSETYDAGDTSWQMVDNAGSANGYVLIGMSGLTIGQSYIVSVTLDNNATLDAGYNHRISHLNGLAGENVTNFTHWNKTNGSSETLTGVFVAQSVNDDDILIYANAITLNVSNFIVRAVDDEDRSVNNKGLGVYGTITKSAVATGAELVAYSGWSSSNYLSRPYNGDIDVGTGDFSIAIWAKADSFDSYNAIFAQWRENQTGTAQFSLETVGSVIRFYVIDSGSYSYAGGDTTLSTGVWYQFIVTRKSGLITLYVNGVPEATTDSYAGDLTARTDPTSIGVLWSSTGPFGGATGAWKGSLTLCRFSASAPSAEQVKKMYEDEKVLFQENAACTLYGSSDAVTALAYDEVTEQLHVGTSSGRSDFQGLRRINNTTTAVTTAISAHDEFIVEQ